MLGPENPVYPEERRLLQDRRKSGLMSQLKGIVRFGQRRQLRRVEDRRKMALLDHYQTPLLISAVIILILSLGDAILTLILISNGAIELNPIMNYLLKAGTIQFILGKFSLTAIAVLIILLFNYYPMRGLKIPVPSFLTIFAMIFSAVIVWQIYLITRFVL